MTIQQPTLAKYRVPVFREFAGRAGINLKVYYGQTPSISNIEPEGFMAEMVPMRTRRLLGQEFAWHGPQWRFACRGEADVLVLQWNMRYLSLIPGLLRARKNGVRTVLWGHGYSKRAVGWRNCLRDRMARLADAVLFYNRTAAQAYIDRGGNSDRVYVAINSLNQSPIQTARQHWLDRPAELDRFKREHGLDAGPVILFVSRLDPANRLDLLLHATEQLRDQHPGLQTVIIGKGEPEGRRLRELAALLNLTDCVRFPGAIYDEEQLAPWFLSADVFCYPANIGLSILHAFGYGLPVITSDDLAAQNPEIEALRDGENGLFYRHGGAGALAAALDQLLSNPDRATKMAAAAHRTATEEWTLEKMVDGMEAAVRSCTTRTTHA